MSDFYFGQQKVKEFGEAEGLVWVEYENGGHETMRKEEWSAGQSLEQAAEGRDFVLRRIKSVAEEVLAVLYAHNVRLEEMGDLLTMVRDTIQLRVNQAKETAFGQPAWTVRLDDIRRVLEDAVKSENYGPNLTGEVLRQVRGNFIDY